MNRLASGEVRSVPRWKTSAEYSTSDPASPTPVAVTTAAGLNAALAAAQPGHVITLAGGTYTIADMALWGWARLIPFILGEEAWAKLPNLKRLTDEISARPAAARAVALKDRFTFKAEMDGDARRHMFKHMRVA